MGGFYKINAEGSAVHARADREARYRYANVEQRCIGNTRKRQSQSESFQGDRGGLSIQFDQAVFLRRKG